MIPLLSACHYIPVPIQNSSFRVVNTRVISTGRHLQYKRQISRVFVLGNKLEIHLPTFTKTTTTWAWCLSPLLIWDDWAKQWKAPRVSEQFFTAAWTRARKVAKIGSQGIGRDMIIEEEGALLQGTQTTRSEMLVLSITYPTNLAPQGVLQNIWVILICKFYFYRIPAHTSAQKGEKLPLGTVVMSRVDPCTCTMKVCRGCYRC